MSIDTSVKFFHSGMTGAPQLTTAAGSLLTILRACLVSGFGAVAVDSIAVASGVATLTISAGMPFTEVDSVILVSGCALAALNGEKKISAVGTTTLTFDAAGLADGSYSGGISAKIAPAGWTELFTGTNVAAFQSLDPKSTKCCLRVDDSKANCARVVGFETMTNANTGAGRVPLLTQINPGLVWPKCAYSDVSYKIDWFVISDGRSIFYAAAPYPDYSKAFAVYFFGDLIATVPNNPFAWSIQGGAGGNFNGEDEESLSIYNSRIGVVGSQGLFMPRNGNGAGGSTPAGRAVSYSGGAGSYAFGDSGADIQYPSKIGGALTAAPILCSADEALIGGFPGVLAPICKCGALVFGSRIKIGMRNYFVVSLAGSGEGPFGSIFFDITGPWQ